MDVQIDKVIFTKRNKTCLIFNNFKFREVRELTSGGFFFRCTNKMCKASVHTDESVVSILKMMNFPHNHDSYTSQVIARDTVKSLLKRKAVDELNMRQKNCIKKEPKIKPSRKSESLHYVTSLISGCACFILHMFKCVNDFFRIMYAFELHNGEIVPIA